MSNRRNFIKQLSALGIINNVPDALLIKEFSDPLISWNASGNGGVVAGGPAPSALAGIDILNKRGNAVDAAVAVILNLAVSDYGMFSIGGEVPFMYYSSKDAKINVFNGMGGAPKDQRFSA